MRTQACKEQHRFRHVLGPSVPGQGWERPGNVLVERGDEPVDFFHHIYRGHAYPYQATLLGQYQPPTRVVA